MGFPDLNEIEGLQIIPVNDKKVPTVKNWQTTIQKYDLSNCAGVGLVCGFPSGNVQALDLDLKYDETGTLFERYKQAIHHADNTLLKKLVVQKTRNNGIHFIFRCNKIEGNQKLANRHTTELERKETYNATYATEILKEGVDDAIAKKRAEKSADGDKVRVLIETRGTGGQILIAPSKGYEFIFGDLCSIVEITEEERDILFTIARSFNEVFDEVVVPKTQQPPKMKGNGLSPFEDYNERGDIVQLLTSHGWKFVKNKGNKIHFQRPGQTSAETSGNFDTSSGWFSVFTTSTEFETNHGYRPYAVFAVLECNKDFSAASKKLYEMGYGERTEVQTKEKAPSTRVIPSRVDPNDNDLSFLADGNDYDGYLQQAKDGTLPMGLSTGSLVLDEHFRFKKGNLVMFNGHDNVGKSVFSWWLLMLTALYYDWKWIVFSSENSLGAFMRKMIEFYWGVEIGKQTPVMYATAKSFVESHFKLIKHEENLFNYKDVMNMVRKARKALPDYQNGLIDPYNSLKTDLSGFSKLSTHEYHYEAMSELQADCQANKFTWYVNHHVITEAGRRVDAEGYQVAPNKADTEGGAKVANKSHDFGTIHRKINHPQDWMIVEFHIRKIKETETGGRPTPINAPVRFRTIKNKSAFEEVREDGIPAIDPIARWHQTHTASCPEEKHWADRDDFPTFEQFKEQEAKAATVIDFSKKVKNATLEEYVPSEEEQEELDRLKAIEQGF